MPDTGAPWNIPYVESTDLVSDWPADSLALANAIDAGLDAAGGLVDVKSALFTGTQTNSTASQANFAVTDLSISHTLSDAANSLVIMAYLGGAATTQQDSRVGLAVADDGTLIAVGDAASNRTQVAAGGRVQGTLRADVVVNLAATFVYAPGDTAAHTYTVRAVNINNATETIYINRTQDDTDSNFQPRNSSGLIIMEVKV